MIQNKHGFTLIELLLYIAIVSGIVLAITTFVTNLIQGRIKSNLQENVSHNLRFSMHRLTHEIRESVNLLDLTSTNLCLEKINPTLNPTRIYLLDGILYLGRGGDCNNSTISFPLTSNNIVVSNLNFSTNNATVNFSYNLAGKTYSTRQEWLYDTVASGSSTIR